jgi:hypothetical protein
MSNFADSLQKHDGSVTGMDLSFAINFLHFEE